MKPLIIRWVKVWPKNGPKTDLKNGPKKRTTNNDCKLPTNGPTTDLSRAYYRVDRTVQNASDRRDSTPQAQAFTQALTVFLPPPPSHRLLYLQWLVAVVVAVVVVVVVTWARGTAGRNPIWCDSSCWCLCMVMADGRRSSKKEVWAYYYYYFISCSTVCVMNVNFRIWEVAQGWSASVRRVFHSSLLSECSR